MLDSRIGVSSEGPRLDSGVEDTAATKAMRHISLNAATSATIAAPHNLGNSF